MGKKSDAHGGNGDIFFSEDNLTATKRLRNTSTKEKINRYKREVEVMQTLQIKKIPNIVEIYGVELVEEHPEQSKIIMKKYDGCLSDLISLTKGNVKYSLGLLLPIIKALKALSENSPAIYHRDLKPENILYQKVGDVYELYLTDFGICFLKDDDERLTQEITAVGARMFMAPEYEIGRVENVTEKGDIFSIGKIIWWMVNGIENALLPSNFWFVKEFDLMNRFPEDPLVVSVNVVIASCLKINPDERCNYNQLITMIENILKESVLPQDAEKQYLVEAAMEKRKIQFKEKLAYNKQLVNVFSTSFLTALKKICQQYPSVVFLQTIENEYRKRSKDGIDYTSKNVIDDADHYLYTHSFDDIYIHIDYKPAPKGEKYANIVFRYSIRSAGKSESMIAKYNGEGMVITEYKGNTEVFTEETVVKFLEDLILNYIG